MKLVTPAQILLTMLNSVNILFSAQSYTVNTDLKEIPLDEQWNSRDVHTLKHVFLKMVII